ncbi:MAG: hypothetical protein ACIAQF_03870 [Phycisphaerales bacterium JB065]
MPTLHLISIESPICGPTLLHALSRIGAEVALLGVPDPSAIQLPTKLKLRFSCHCTGPRAARDLRRQLASSATNHSRLVCWDDLAFEAAQNCRHPHLETLAVPDVLATVPPLETAPTPLERNTIRDALGVSPDQRVLLPLGSSECIDAFELVRIVGILAFAGEPITLLLPERSQQIERARRFLSLHEGDWQTVNIPRTTLDHFRAADATIIWTPTEHTRRDSLARLKSDAMMALHSGLAVVCRGQTGEALQPLPVTRVSSNAPVPMMARAVRHALTEPKERDNPSLPDFADWASSLHRFIEASAQPVAQGC